MRVISERWNKETRSDAKTYMNAKSTGPTKMTMVSHFIKNVCAVVRENP